jgi:hypothetical protein
MATITIKIYVPDVTNVLLSFDIMQVQRSKLGDPYTDAAFITTTAAAAPVLTGTTEGPFSGLSGEQLKVKVNGGAEQTVTFISADPISLTNALGEINDAIADLTAANDGTGKVELTGNLTGTEGTIEVTGGGAAAILGLSQVIVHGTDQHIGLQAGVDEYSYSDLSGEASYWYRTRYYNSSTSTYGGWSDWIQGSTGAAVAASELIVGKIQVADIDGSALSDLKVTLVNVYSPLTADGYFLAGRSKQIETDGSGLAETTLIKGMVLDVVVEGTSIIRRITVPSTGTEFDLLDASLVTDDPFQIQVPDLPSAVRRS